MQCQFHKDCKSPAVWIFEYPENDGELKALCAEHAAYGMVKEQRLINVISIRCNGPHAIGLKERLKKKNEEVLSERKLCEGVQA
jgi:hypothetical protein